MSRQRIVIKPWFLTLVVTLLLTIIFASPFAASAALQIDGERTNAEDGCGGLRVLMASDRTPHDLPAAGGVLSPNIAEAITINADQYAAYHILNVTRPENQANTQLSVGFSDLTPDASLEVGLFRGLEPIGGDYRPVTNAQTQTYTVAQGGLYTLVVRRADLGDMGEAVNYTAVADFSGTGEAVPTALRDETTGASAQGVTFINGYQLIPLSGAKINIHADAATTVASRDGTTAQIRYGQNGLQVGSWAKQIALLGGDLAVTGEVTVDGAAQPRILYIQDFGHEVSLSDLNLGVIVDADGNSLNTDWGVVRGVWLLRDCLGMKLLDGRTFVAALAATDPETGEVTPAQVQRPPRNANFSGSLADFDIRVNAPADAGLPSSFTSYILDLSWNGIAENSEMRLGGGVLSVDLLGGKHLDVGDRSISMFRRPGEVAGAPVQENTPLEVVGRGHDVMLLVDWRNLNHLAFTNETLRIGFTDARGAVIRNGDNLMRFESLEDTVRIVEKPNAAGIPGEHSLWLGADMGYIEIVTPAQQPTFDNQALPGEAGYFPRALNNLGGECYPTNTLLPEANCPPNGHVNPANGNLWYGVADLVAAGGWIDLTLSRSYNLLARGVDGPFGPGWATAFALDYAIPYDETTQSRRIAPDHVYRVGLDLTWTPRGIVTFTTPSGSRHTFVSPNPPSASTPGYDGTETEALLTAITMPGWTLRRLNPQDNWTLRQSDGLTYTFDRAGRLLSYGYPDLSRVISVNYDRAALPGQTAESTAIITDDATQRRLELVYNADGRIARAILRDMTIPSFAAIEAGAPCSEAVNCQETRYEYDAAGMLTRVHYADGQQADYTYDADGRLLTHNDPRAPISPRMAYTYTQNGVIATIRIATITVGTTAGDVETAQVWRRFAMNTTETERRFSVIEPASPPLPDAPELPESISPDRATTYVYTLAEPPGPNTPTLPFLRQAGNGYTLKSITGPLAGTGAGIDGEPQTYTWNNGLLTSINARGVNENVGRNSITFAYRPDGQITELGQGVIGFTVRNYNADGLPGRVSYGDLSEVVYTYDAQNRPLTIVDRQNGRYSITWDESGRPARLLRENDGFIWTYSYNALGLVTLENRNGHLITYAYDGLGRLVSVDDPLLGRYTLTYALVTEAVSSKAQGVVAQVTMTDAGRVTHTARYDGRGRLVETIMAEPGEAAPVILRHTTWAYDNFDRVTSETVWAGNDDQPLETRVTYDDMVLRLEPLPGQPNTPQDTPIIKGYAVTKTDSVGRTQRYVYDALGRIREVLGDYGRRQRYDYAYDNVAVTANDVTLPKGIRIQQRDLLGELRYATTTYEYSERWQLREVTRTTGTAPQPTHIWSLATQGDPVRPTYTVLESRSMGIASLNWGVDPASTDPRPTSAQINPVSLTLASGASRAAPRHNAKLDFLGRPITVTDGGGISSSVAYCPVPDGSQRVLLFQPAVTPTPTLTAQNQSAQDQSLAALCPRGDFQYEMVYDAHGRLIQSTEANGERGSVRRVFTYTRENTYWKVSATFGAGSSVGRWTQHYNMAGDLIYWQDENGIERTYTYDSAGRLSAVTADDLPEASYTFSYDDETGLLEQAIDGLDRGWTYQYDTRGLLLSRQQVETANATTYGYDSAGRLTSVISPLGNTTVYRYGDANDPWRVTEIVDATGVVHRYSWDDAANVLTYRDIRGRENRYYFDALGALWMIEERGGEGGGSPRITELRYNAAGELTDVAVNPVINVAGNTRATQHFTINRGTQFGDPIVIGETGVSDWSWAFTFNADGLLTGVTDPEGQPLTASYDALRRLTAIDAGAHDWALAYPPDNATLNISHSLNNRAVEAAQVTFDALYRLTALNIVNPDGSVAPDDLIETQYVYTAGRDLSVTHVQQDSDGEPTERSYTFFPGDNTANPRTVTLTAQGLNDAGDGVELGSPSGQIMTVVYNPENLIEEIRHATCVAESDGEDGEESDCTQDAAGSAFFTTFTRFLYDAQGRPIRINDAERGLEVFNYDDVGNLISYQTINGRAFNYEYDARNRLRAITGPTGIKVLVTYNDLDQVIAVCRARAEEINNFADCEAIDQRPDTDVIVEEYAYDSLGRLTEQRFRNAGQAAESVITNSYTGGLLTEWGLPGAARVERTYSEDALSLLRRVKFDSNLADFYDLDDDLTLTGESRLKAQNSSSDLPDIAYSYDAFGRLAQLVYGGTAFRLDYQANRQGYRFTESESGEGVGFGLDTSGLLAALTYSASGDAPDTALAFDYIAVQRATDILQIGIGTGDAAEDAAELGRNFIYELDRQGQTLSQATDFELVGADGSGLDGLFVVNRFALNLAGQVNRQQVDGSPPSELFVSDSDGYVTVTGYDDNYRLTTIAITSKTDGRPLYTLNFAYNAVGQRESETRRFEDDTQIDINYVYNVSSQLTQRTVEIIRPGQRTNVLNSWPLLALIPLLLFSRLHRRTVYRLPRKVMVIALGAVLVGSVMLGSVVWGQQAGGMPGRESFTFDYTYDLAGNLGRITYVPNGQPDAAPTECAVYRYDAANRLVEVQAERRIVGYSYDVHNRLMRLSAASTPSSTTSSNIRPDEADVWQVVYAGALPIAAYSQADEMIYYGRVDDHPPFFLGQEDGLTWLVSDGRDRILTTVAETSTATDLNPILVLDPVGRPLEFTPPQALAASSQNAPAAGTPVVGNPCQLSRISAESDIIPPLPAFDGMLWDPNTNLYFSGGRAYLPEVGRFLQRSTDGPDAFGSVYDFARRPDIPVQHPSRPPLVNGLGLLDEALDTIRLVDSLAPAAVKASHQPAPHMLDTTAVWTDALGGRAPNQAALARLQALPSWLQSAYNLPEPQLNSFTGDVELPLSNAPGQGGVGLSAATIDLPTFPGRDWLPSTPTIASADIATAPQPSFARVNSYRSLAWTPYVGLAGWSSAWDVSLPRLDGSDTPAAVLDWLPRPLTAPTASGVMDTLRLIEAIRTLPFETGYDWLVRLLRGAMPALPDLPPLNEADWRTEWFDTDTFGLRKALASRYDVPAAPDVPIYGLFPNLDWLRGE